MYSFCVKIFFNISCTVGLLAINYFNLVCLEVFISIVLLQNISLGMVGRFVCLFFLLTLKGVTPFSSHLHRLWYEICYNFYPYFFAGNKCLPTPTPYTAASIFSFCFGFQQFEWDMPCSFFFLIYFIFSNLLISVVQCLLLILEISWPLFLQIFILPSSFFSFWNSI